MKKIFMAIAFAAILMIPFTSFAMTQVADSDLATVTGQAGVSINLDVNMDVHADVIAWGDADGFANGAGSALATVGDTGNTGGAGWVGLAGVDANGIRIRLRQDVATLGYLASQVPTIMGPKLAAAYSAFEGATFNWPADEGAILGNTTFGAYMETAAGASGKALYEAVGFYALNVQGNETAIGVMVAAVKPLTIDVATSGASGPYTSGVTFVRIGLGSLEIQMASLDANVQVGSTHSLGEGTIGSIYMAGLDAYVVGTSYVDIYNDRSSGQGVTINLNILLDKINIGTLAWGDTGGLESLDAGYVAGTSAGWIGLKNVAITNMSIAGPITIDVATSGTKTSVAIGFGGGLTVGIGTMDATVALGASKTNLNQELGSIYLAGLSADITGSVGISAHAASGVDLNLALSITTASMTLSWGNNAGASNAGFVGLKSLTLGTIAINGLVSIDVATVTARPAGFGAYLTPTEYMYSLYTSNNLSASFVHIGLGSGSGDDTSSRLVIGIGSIAADVVLAGNKTLTGTNAGTLGKFYASGITASMNGWVDIAAH